MSEKEKDTTISNEFIRLIIGSFKKILQMTVAGLLKLDEIKK